MKTILRNVRCRGGVKCFLYALLISIFSFPVLAAAQTPVVNETQKLVATDGGAAAYFGGAVGIDGELAVVGASGNNAAYVFERHSGSWLETGKLEPTEIGANVFGASVAVSGPTVLVGAPDDDPCGTSSGSAYVFNDLGSWTATARLIGEPCYASDNFGSAVSIDGDVAWIGAPGFNYLRGEVFVFERTAEVWIQVRRLIASDSGLSDMFGSAVDVSGNYAIVGAPQDFGVAEYSGSAYVFEREPGGAWGQTQKLLAGDGTENDRFGTAVAVSGPYIAIGAPYSDFGGSVYVFERIDGIWTQVARLEPDAAMTNRYFGNAVSFDGERIVVGARNDVVSETNTGAAYLFERTGESWMETAKLVSSDIEEYDNFGGAVAVSATTALVGTRGDDDLGLSSGSAYVFEISVSQPGCDPAVDPPTLDFGEIKVGETVTLATTLTNEGDEICDVTAYVVSPSGEFALNAGSPGSFTVATGESADVLVDYGPVDMGDDTGTLELAIADPASQIDVPLTGGAAVEVFDLDIAQFRASRAVRYREGATRPVTITLSVSNAGTLDGDAPATVTGVRADSVEVYRQTLTVSDDVGGAPQSFAYPDYLPTAAGDIAWTVTLDDGYPDVDEATATTRVW